MTEFIADYPMRFEPIDHYTIEITIFHVVIT